MKNLERYKNDLEKLIKRGEALSSAMEYKCNPKDFEEIAREKLGKKASKHLENLPKFSEEYETWYSEATALVGQVLPDRLDDFVGYYEKPKARKSINYESYRISDHLMNLHLYGGVDGTTVLVGPDAAIPRFDQQLAIVRAVRHRFESSLFDIRQIAQAELFDSELEVAMALVKHGFLRAGGAVAGVVMEKHLAEVCRNHQIKIGRKNPTIANFNNALKEANVVDTPQWRLNQHLGDLRNLCDHDKGKEPSEDEATELIKGVMKLVKTLF